MGWNRIHGSSHVVCRLANVYGPRQEASLEGGVVAIFLERLGSGAETVVFGDGKQTRDFVFVGDVVAALIAASSHEGGIFNVGTGEETTVLELLEACGDAVGQRAEPRHEPERLGDVRRSVLDVRLAESELGFRAETSLTDGIARTWAWAAARGRA